MRAAWNVPLVEYRQRVASTVPGRHSRARGRPAARSHAGRGVESLIIGAFLVYAGWYVEEVEARGFGDILRVLENQPFGAWVLIAVAAGLTAYGLYLLLAAWYLRLIAAW